MYGGLYWTLVIQYLNACKSVILLFILSCKIERLVSFMLNKNEQKFLMGFSKENLFYDKLVHIHIL